MLSCYFGRNTVKLSGRMEYCCILFYFLNVYSFLSVSVHSLYMHACVHANTLSWLHARVVAWEMYMLVCKFNVWGYGYAHTIQILVQYYINIGSYVISICCCSLSSWEYNPRLLKQTSLFTFTSHPPPPFSFNSSTIVPNFMPLSFSPSLFHLPTGCWSEALLNIHNQGEEETDEESKESHIQGIKTVL